MKEEIKQPDTIDQFEESKKNIKELLNLLTNGTSLTESDLPQKTINDSLDFLYYTIKRISEDNLAFNSKLAVQTRNVLASGTNKQGEKHESLQIVSLNLLLESIIMNPELIPFEDYISIYKIEMFNTFFEKFPVYNKIHRFNCILHNNEITLKSLTSIKNDMADILKDYNIEEVGDLNNNLMIICFINEMKQLNISTKSNTKQRHKIFGLFKSIFKKTVNKKIKRLNAALLLNNVNSVLSYIETDATKEKLTEQFIELLNKKEEVKVTKDGILKLVYKFKDSFFESVDRNINPNDYTIGNETGFSIFDVPDDLIKHSHFVCPVSLQDAGDDNPPVLLECGHMICRKTLNSMVERVNNIEDSDEDENNHQETLNCPICRNSLSYKHAKNVYF